MKNLTAFFKQCLFFICSSLLFCSYKFHQIYREKLSVSVLAFFSVLLILASPTKIQAAPAYDASLSVSASPSTSVDAGGLLSYNVVINSEAGKINNPIIVTSLFNEDFSYISYTGTNWNCTNTISSVACTYSKDINNNAASDTLTFTISPTANGTTTSITNTASIAIIDDDTTNNQATITTTVNPVADLSVVKTASANSVNAGDAFSYTLTATNAGPYAAQNVVLTDTLPSGVLYNGYTAPSGWSCNFSSGKLVCNIATFSPSASNVITMNVIAPPSAGTITNTASITSSSVELDSTNNTSSVTTTVNALLVDLAITKTATPYPDVITASPLEYTINVRNNGSSNTTGVKVTDTLDSRLLFVSVNGGTDWSCSQGSSIVCDYVGNGGVLTPTATPQGISLKVTTPVAPGTITNSASVTSNVTDINVIDNESSVTVTVSEGTISSGEVPMYKYLQYNLFGDMRLIGNANINYSGSDPNEDYNDDVDMRYVDNDSNSNTFNSSFSTLDINASYEIVWAGLYWEGKLCSDNDSDECVYPSNSGYNTFNASKDHRDDVLFKTPHRSDYITVTANRVFTAERSSTNWSYGAFADVTHLLDPDEIGEYGVANIALSSRYSDGRGGNYGGWAMLVIYKDPSNQLHYKNVSVFNGFDFVDDVNNPTQIYIDGFITPLNGSVNGSVALFAADGDPVVGGYMQMRQGNTNNYGYVSDTANPWNNVLNSTITEFGQEINSGVTKTYGVDADRLDVSGFLTNDQQNTNFKFGAGTDSQKDYYSLSLFAFATDLTTPIIDNFTKEALIIDMNSTTRIAAPGEPIYPGSELLYTLTFTNSGDEIATLFEIFDDFDFDGLTYALDLDNFDITKTHLYSGTDTSGTPIANACGYDSADHRVYCRLDTVAIDATYTMQFSVTVADPIDASMLDENATNTAYTIYKNPNGDDYVVLQSTAYGDFGGKSNSLNAGIFTSRGSSYLATESVDAINANYTYSVDRNITTKIVNSDFQLKLVYLDTLGENVQFSNSLGFSMPVLLSLCTSGERLIEDGVATPQFTNGISEIIANGLNLTKAHQNDKIKMAFVNWGNIDWDAAGVNCVQRSSTTGNYKGVPQCLNSENKILQVFPEESWPYIYEVCLGNELTLTGSQVPACDSSAYSGWVPNPAKQILPEKYDHTYGCLQCLTDASAQFQSCSTDNFAARPDHYLLNSTNVSYPDLLRSGVDYNLSLQALDGANDPTHPTTDYNQNKHNLDINQTLYLSDDTEDTSHLMHGTVDWTASDFNITDGLSVAPGTVSNEVLGLTFDDVGKANISIEDHIWAFVDWDDTPLDCTSTLNSYGVSIEGPAYICGDVNTTFIPDHFNVTNIHLNNHAQTTFTYLSNDLNMSAHVDVTISAMNANEGITQNFNQESGFYENPVSVDLNVTKLHPLGNAVIIKDIPTALLLGFGSPDANGTHIIPWNESNATQKIMFNYARNNNQEVNPFDVNGTELNVTVVSTYTGTAPEGTAIIDGDGIGDQNATFYFARTRSSKFFYDDIIDPSAITPIFIDVYCDLGPASCSDLGIDTINGQTNEFIWWLSWDHRRSRNDGNITLTIGGVIEGAGAPTVSGPPQPNIEAEGADKTVTVTANATALPMTVEIDLVTDDTLANYTNSWLIYNTEDAILAPDPFYKVRFIGTSGWAGHGKTGHVVDSNTSIKKNRRLEW